MYLPVRALRRAVIPLLALALVAAVSAQTRVPASSAAPEIGFAIIKTAKVSVMQGLLKPGPRAQGHPGVGRWRTAQLGLGQGDEPPLDGVPGSASAVVPSVKPLL